MKMRTLSGAIVVTLLLLCNLSANTGADVPDCSAEVVQLAPCLSFVADEAPTPSQTCCDALKTVVTKTPVCLCELVGRGKNGTANSGLPPINLTLVRQLPKDCGIQTEIQKDEALCRAAAQGAPVGVPSPSPLAPSPSLAPPLSLPSIFSLFLWVVVPSIPVVTTRLCLI